MYSYSKAYTTANAKKYYQENKQKCLEYQKAYREKKKEQKIKDVVLYRNAVHVSSPPNL